MMDIKMTMDGLDELRAAFEKASEETRRKVHNVVTATTMRVHTSARRRIQRGPKTGKLYIKTDPNRSHQASAPGEAPATDTGTLANSIFWWVDPVRGGFVYTNLEYAHILEFSMNRPFLFPSMEEQAPQFKRELSEVLK